MEMIIAFIPNLYFPILIGVGIYFCLLGAINMIDMKLHAVPPTVKDGPLVSVLIPARNEEQNIERCLYSLRNQDYLNYEILVIDDNSTDNTFNIIRKIAREDKRVRVFPGKPLPEDWFGKPYAMQQLSGEAKGEIFVFTDADTIHNPTCISWTVSNIQNSKVDFISGYTKQKLLTFGEAITVPLMYFLTTIVVPIFLNRYTRWTFFSAAIGQFIAVNREAFEKVGGYTTIRNKPVEDMYLARLFKRQGYQTIFLDLKEQILCRMYTGYQAALEGIGKNIFVFFGKNSVLLFIVAVLVVVFIFLPFPLSFILWFIKSPFFIHVLIANCLFTLAFIIQYLDREIPWYYAFLWPIIFLNYIYVGIFSWFRTVSGKGFIWKDRVVR
ncbi:MAG: glycosyltransferase family 2 protein [Spirochaetaceae bacterium]|jgi:chlorobactene glucosyltransferase|nr:glycosyltransferase family 2 protein [Spirochaetaceae bacterium]